VTDQRHRLSVSWIAEPQPFGRGQEVLSKIFNEWKIAGVLSFGSGRPTDARVTGDPNRDDNSSNDRLAGYGRNGFLGPDYATTDLRLTRKIHVTERLRIELTAESFNLFNRDNQRYSLSTDGFQNSAGQFVPLDRKPRWSTVISSVLSAAYKLSQGHKRVCSTARAARPAIPVFETRTDVSAHSA